MAKGVRTGGGSRKGRPNKTTKALKDMILGALSDAGGQEYLVRQSNENPTAFMALLGKVLPLALTDGDGGALKFKLEAPWWQEVMTARGVDRTDTARVLNS